MRKINKFTFFVTALALRVDIMPRKPNTVCEIFEADGLLTYGISHCRNNILRSKRLSESAILLIRTNSQPLYLHLGDEFDLRTGMRQALTSALRKSDFTKEAREKIWVSYFAKESEIREKKP